MFWFLWVGTLTGIVALFGLLASLGAPYLLCYLAGSLVIAGSCWLAAWLENKHPRRHKYR